jgi:hypothetical protein
VILWGLTGLTLGILLLKFFVADVYRVDSGSMRPTLFGGRDRADGVEDAEHVLVFYDRALEPARFDLVVVRTSEEDKPLVKRVCGIPGDQDLMIRDGDLFLDRARLPPDAPRPAPVLVYDDRFLDPTQFFEHRRDGSVSRADGEWVVRGDAQPAGSLLAFHPGLRDDYLDRWHRRVEGLIEVNDAVLELEFALSAPLAAQKLRFQLIEEGDLFEVAIAAGPEGGWTMRLVRRDPRGQGPEQERQLAQCSVALEPGRWYALAFSNIDNHLRVRSAGLGADLRYSYAENEPLSPPARHKSLRPRVRFGVEGGEARFRAVRILRDLYYTEDGRFGVTKTTPGGAELPEDGLRAAVSLGPHDYFLLGDNSAASTDSRHFGPVKAAQLLGRPVAVVWPDPHWLRPSVAP